MTDCDHEYKLIEHTKISNKEQINIYQCLLCDDSFQERLIGKLSFNEGAPQ